MIRTLSETERIHKSFSTIQNVPMAFISIHPLAQKSAQHAFIKLSASDENYDRES